MYIYSNDPYLLTINNLTIISPENLKRSMDKFRKDGNCLNFVKLAKKIKVY